MSEFSVVNDVLSSLLQIATPTASPLVVLSLLNLLQRLAHVPVGSFVDWQPCQGQSAAFVLKMPGLPLQVIINCKSPVPCFLPVYELRVRIRTKPSIGIDQQHVVSQAIHGLRLGQLQRGFGRVSFNSQS
jgi:hypothetical protein